MSGGPFEIQKLPQSHVLSWSWGRGGVGEEEEGRQGERPSPPSGQRRCDCSRPSNCCHTLSMGNTGTREGLKEAERKPPTTSLSHPPSATRPIREVWHQGPGRGKRSDWLSGRRRRSECWPSHGSERRRDVVNSFSHS